MFKALKLGGTAAVIALMTTAAYPQGVPIFDAQRAAENARELARMAEDAALQEAKLAERRQLDEIKAQQLAALQEIIASASIPVGGDVATMVADLEAGAAPAAAASAVYPATESTASADQLFGDARGNVEQIIIQVARETHSLPGVGKAGLSVVQWRALLQALIWQESRFNASAQSPVGAYGLTQIMPGTARDLGIYPAYRTDPVMQVRGGARYLAQRLNDFDGNVVLALAAYNAGAGNVRKYGGVPPFKETQHYVQVIPRKYNEYLARVGGIDALGTIEPGLLANAQLGMQGMSAMGYGDYSQATVQQAAQRLASIIEQIDGTADYAAAQSLNTYARAEIGRLMVLMARVQAANAKPISAEQIAIATQQAEENAFLDLTMENF